MFEIIIDNNCIYTEFVSERETIPELHYYYYYSNICFLVCYSFIPLAARNSKLTRQESDGLLHTRHLHLKAKPFKRTNMKT